MSPVICTSKSKIYKTNQLQMDVLLGFTLYKCNSWFVFGLCLLLIVNLFTCCFCSCRYLVYKTKQSELDYPVLFHNLGGFFVVFCWVLLFVLGFFCLFFLLEILGYTDFKTLVDHREELIAD